MSYYVEFRWPDGKCKLRDLLTRQYDHAFRYNGNLYIPLGSSQAYDETIQVFSLTTRMLESISSGEFVTPAEMRISAKPIFYN